MKPMSENEVVMTICYQTMSAWDFSYSQRREWTIYAARHRVCPDCGAQVNNPCVNLQDQRLGKTPRINRNPHDPRVDWGRMIAALKQRGYYRPSIENQVRKIADGRAQGKDVELDDENFGDPAETMPEWAKQEGLDG